jgi:fructose-1,6-bisphosphatase I
VHPQPVELAEFLGEACAALPQGPALIRTFTALERAVITLADTIALGSLAGDMGSATAVEGGGDVQKLLDLVANRALHEALAGGDVTWFASEEDPEPVEINTGGSLSLAVDPLDGSSNIDTNSAIGTIFSIRPGCTSADCFLADGTRQLAAGFAIYGPQTALVFTVGNGTHIATLDRRKGRFFVTSRDVRIAPECNEYAINASNRRHWPEGIRDYVDDLKAGREGARQRDFNTRWIASLVADVYRILRRGGVYLYPADSRKGYEQGRLRLVYEAFPIAFLVEQAGGGATDGINRILEKVPDGIHARTPLVCGSLQEVRQLAHSLSEHRPRADKAPLFSSRGLFRN